VTLFPRWHTPEEVATRLVNGLRDGSLVLPWTDQPELSLVDLAESVQAQRVRLNSRLIQCGWAPLEPVNVRLDPKALIAAAEAEKLKNLLNSMKVTLDELELLTEKNLHAERVVRWLLVACWSLNLTLFIIAVGWYITTNSPSLLIGVFVGTILGQLLPILRERLSQHLNEGELRRRLATLFASIQKSETDLRQLSLTVVSPSN
jgi:hypothetical protein